MDRDNRLMWDKELAADYESKIRLIMGFPGFVKFYGLTYWLIITFISKCSIADFEKLKEIDYDLSTAKNESDDTE